MRKRTRRSSSFWTMAALAAGVVGLVVWRVRVHHRRDELELAYTNRAVKDDFSGRLLLFSRA